MVDATFCKIATKFYQNQATMILEPLSKMTNQMTLIIPNLQLGNAVKMRVDKNDVIFSKNAKKADFGLVHLGGGEKELLLRQMKGGDFLFIRFNINGLDQETTVKLNLADFKQAALYYQSRIN